MTAVVSLSYGGISVRIRAMGGSRDGGLVGSRAECRRDGRLYRGNLDTVIFRHELVADTGHVLRLEKETVQVIDRWASQYAP